MLIEDIIKKKELRDIDRGYVLREIEQFLLKNPKVAKKYASLNYTQFRRSKEFTQLLKAVRAQLRTVYGVFQRRVAKRPALLKKIQNLQDFDGHEQLLKTHLSSFERLPYYTTFYREIFAITGAPGLILDLACGLNPVSLPFMGSVPEYIASELSEKDCEFLEEYFRSVGVVGQAVALNLLTDFEKLQKYPVDICFLLKTLDSLEIVHHDISRKILENIRAAFIIVSFPTISVSGKRMKSVRRTWFEKMVKKYIIIEIPNEIVYVVDNKA